MYEWKYSERSIIAILLLLFFLYLLVVFVVTIHQSVLLKPRHLSDSVYRFVRGGTVAVAVLSIRPWACYPVHGRLLIQYIDNLLWTLLYSYLCLAVLDPWAWDPTPTTLPPLYSYPDVARPLTCDNGTPRVRYRNAEWNPLPAPSLCACRSAVCSDWVTPTESVRAVSWGHRMHPATTGPGCFCNVFVQFLSDIVLIYWLMDWLTGTFLWGLTSDWRRCASRGIISIVHWRIYSLTDNDHAVSVQCLLT